MQEIGAVGFEGPEKRLEVEFVKAPCRNPIPRGFRSYDRTFWKEFLKAAQCTILSDISNEFADAYLLSESSLFVFPTKIIIKTCGTTTLLKIVPQLLHEANNLGLRVASLQYSRSCFLFPEKQPFPHSSFEEEINYLNFFLDEGESRVLGPEGRVTRWHVYQWNLPGFACPKNCVEIMMFSLDPVAMKQFYIGEGVEVGTSGGAITTFQTGLESLLGENVIVDAYNFDPCGYSMNALINDVFFTVHITPEPNCSYVSFETNATPVQYSALIAGVLSIFKPSEFAVGITSNDHRILVSSVLESGDSTIGAGYLVVDLSSTWLSGSVEPHCDAPELSVPHRSW
eukprot:CAMPEP_0184682422 /NCGR_PEP_ID=MMETSP0312-20130426/7248_1 /TAXON_ID=31354 /ORGANISM="Compsopogon coeruleus, Strain SAG 36.94" /LENGTH=340 /DNA_ID=CAMNT_0027134083 /DNA_START=234 /DNA_END=1253 /DNA_ORIENTATION=-